MPACLASAGERIAIRSPDDINVAGIRCDRPAQHLDQRRFAGAVLANDADDLAGKNGK